MVKLIRAIIHSSAFRLLIRFFASLASAIVVISGFLYFLNMGQKTKDEEIEDVDFQNEDENLEESSKN